MANHLLRCALGLTLGAALAGAGAADAQGRRAAYKKPRPPALVERPYVREPGCHNIYDSGGWRLPDEMNPNCENAFRRLYPPR
jgi:hypothetical protein